MIEEYYISNDTLLIMPFGKNKTRIYDINGTYTIKKSVSEIVDISCQYYGSNYQGRYVGSKRLLNMDYKLPIIVDEIKEVVIFPTCSPKSDKCIWICVNNIDNYEKYKKTAKIKFINKFSLELNISFNSLENQIMRATLLLMKLKKRKNFSKKSILK